MSNRVSFVFYGNACLIRLIEFAALFAAFEENMCQTSSVRQVVPPDYPAILQPGRALASGCWRGLVVESPYKVIALIVMIVIVIIVIIIVILTITITMTINT